MENKFINGLESQHSNSSYLGWGVSPELASLSQKGSELSSQNPYEMSQGDERFFFGPRWGWGFPWFWGWGRPGWGWGRPGWGRPGHWRQDVQPSSNPYDMMRPDAHYINSPEWNYHHQGQEFYPPASHPEMMNGDERFFFGPRFGFPFFPFFPFFPGFGFGRPGFHHGFHRENAQSSINPYDMMPEAVHPNSSPYDMMREDERFFFGGFPFFPFFPFFPGFGFGRPGFGRPGFHHGFHREDAQSSINPYEMMPEAVHAPSFSPEDERFFFGPGFGWGWGFPGFWGWGRPKWGWGRPGWRDGYHHEDVYPHHPFY